MRFRNTYRQERCIWAVQNKAGRRDAFMQSVCADIDRSLAEERDREWHTRQEIASAIGDIAGTSLESRCDSAARDFKDIAEKQQYQMSNLLAQEEYRRRQEAEARRQIMRNAFGPDQKW